MTDAVRAAGRPLWIIELAIPIMKDLISAATAQAEATPEQIALIDGHVDVVEAAVKGLHDAATSVLDTNEKPVPNASGGTGKTEPE